MRKSSGQRQSLRLLIAMLSALAVLAAACGGGDDAAESPAEPTDDAAVEEPTEEETEEATEAAGSDLPDAEGTNVAALVHLRIPYTQQILDAAQLAADERGAELQIAGPTGVDPPAHVKAMNDAIAAGAEGVATVAFLPDFWVRPINDAVADGTPVYTWDIASPESDQNVHVGPSNTVLGSDVAGAVVEELGADAEGEVVVGICVPGNPVLEARVQGFKDALAEQAPGLEVGDAFDVTADPAENLTTWEQLIQTNEDAVAFAGFCAFDLANLVKIKERDDSAEYKIFGTDTEPDTLRGIQDGVATHTYGQKPFMEGYLAIQLLLNQIVTGEELNGWIDVGTEEVTADNVDAIAEREQAAESDMTQVKDFYQSEIDAILGDIEGSLKPLSEL